MGYTRTEVQTATGATRDASESVHPHDVDRGSMKSWVNAPTSGVEMSVYAVLLMHRNVHGLAWPSVATIAAMLHWSEKTVRLALAGLQAAGLIRQVAAPTPRYSAVYFVVVPEHLESVPSARPERFQVPPKFPRSSQEEIKNARTGAGTNRAPDRGAGTAQGSAELHAVPAPGSGARSAQGAGNEDVSPERAPERQTRAERSAANIARHALRPRHNPGPSSRPGRKSVAPRLPHKPFQLPLPNDTPLAHMEAEVRDAIITKLKKDLPWVATASASRKRVGNGFGPKKS